MPYSMATYGTFRQGVGAVGQRVEWWGSKGTMVGTAFTPVLVPPCLETLALFDPYRFTLYKMRTPS